MYTYIYIFKYMYKYTYALVSQRPELVEMPVIVAKENVVQVQRSGCPGGDPGRQNLAPLPQ